MMSTQTKIDQLDFNMGVCGGAGDEVDSFDWDGKEAVIHCHYNWTFEELKAWLPGFTDKSIKEVLNWLHEDAYIAEGLSVRIWV